MVTTNQNEVKEKILKMIESCLNKNHFVATENYIEFYYEMFGDQLGYTQLKKVLKLKGYE